MILFREISQFEFRNDLQRVALLSNIPSPSAVSATHVVTPGERREYRPAMRILLKQCRRRDLKYCVCT
jgi:hypothetical protein